MMRKTEEFCQGFFGGFSLPIFKTVGTIFHVRHWQQHLYTPSNNIEGLLNMKTNSIARARHSITQHY